MKPKFISVSDGEVVRPLHLDSTSIEPMWENEGLCGPVENCVQNSNRVQCKKRLWRLLKQECLCHREDILAQGSDLWVPKRCP